MLQIIHFVIAVCLVVDGIALELECYKCSSIKNKTCLKTHTDVIKQCNKWSKGCFKIIDVSGSQDVTVRGCLPPIGCQRALDNLKYDLDRIPVGMGYKRPELTCFICTKNLCNFGRKVTGTPLIALILFTTI